MSDHRMLPGVFAAPPLRAHVYSSGDACRIGVYGDGCSTEVGIWTTRAGLEALRDLLNVVLVSELESVLPTPAEDVPF